jgi:PIN domain nuclease of toxin-antitoxin system
VTVLDSFAVLALLKGEPAAAEVRRLIHDGSCMLTTLGVAEVVDHLVRIVGVSDEEAALDVAQLGLADVEPLDSNVALRAGLLRARHYHRRSRAVSLADCVAAETARALGESLATSDPHLLETCRDEGISVLVLPDSSGATWSS